jgi:hypothetical protein
MDEQVQRDWLCGRCRFGGYRPEVEHCYMFKERPEILDMGLCGQFQPAQTAPRVFRGEILDESIRRALSALQQQSEKT